MAWEGEKKGGMTQITDRYIISSVDYPHISCVRAGRAGREGSVIH